MFNRKRFAAVLAAAVAVAAVAPAQSANVGKVVFFGDSLSDTGNIWYATNGFPTLPYNQGTQGLGPDKTGGQWSDQLGPSWSTVFAKQFGLLATPSLVGGNNYAWGGARTGVNAAPAGAPWLNQQVGQYLFGNAPTKQTLLTVMMGGNDVANNLGNVAALQAGIASITGSLNALYAAGGRQFLVANVPDIGATPTFQDLDADNPGTAAFATFWTTQWNAALAGALAGLNLPGAKTSLLDLYALGKDPKLLAGYANTTDACLTSTSLCADPSTYFYWDSFHPTSTTHAAIAKYAAQAIGVPEPAALALMLLGLGGLAATTRRRKQG